jgi:hypothetical protein
LDISRAIFGPAKNNTPLRINTNAVKALEFALERFKSIPRRGAQVVKDLGSIQYIELIKRKFMYLAWELSGMTARNAVK